MKARGGVRFSVNGNTLLSGSYDGTVGSGTEERGGRSALHEASGTSGSAAFSKDGKSILSGDLEGTARLWGIASQTTTEAGKPRSRGRTHWRRALSWREDPRRRA